MVSFTVKKIVKSKTVGEKLKEIRQDKNISLSQASKDLKIAYKYLEAMEANQFSRLPGRAYFKAFLKKYCQYLHLDFSDLWHQAKSLGHFEPKGGGLGKTYFFPWRKILKFVLIAVIFLAIFIFLAWRVEQIFRPPYLHIIEPADGLITGQREIRVYGQSLKEADIVINNKAIFVDNQGFFETKIDLQKGLNLIKISARKRYSRENIVNLRVLLSEDKNQ